MVHDCPLLFEGVRVILAGEPGVRIVGEARSATDVLVLCSETAPDVVIADLGSSETEALRVLKQIKELCADARIVVLAPVSGPQRIRAAAATGAEGFVSRNAPGDHLVAALRAVLRGQCYVDPELAGALISSVATLSGEVFPCTDSGYASLTAREREVLRLLATGMNNKSIACELRISYKTVQTHHLRIMRKLELHDTVDLIRYAAAIGLIEVEQWVAV